MNAGDHSHQLYIAAPSEPGIIGLTLNMDYEGQITRLWQDRLALYSGTR